MIVSSFSICSSFFFLFFAHSRATTSWSNMLVVPPPLNILLEDDGRSLCLGTPARNASAVPPVPSLEYVVVARPCSAASVCPKSFSPVWTGQSGDRIFEAPSCLDGRFAVLTQLKFRWVVCFYFQGVWVLGKAFPFAKRVHGRRLFFRLGVLCFTMYSLNSNF